MVDPVQATDAYRQRILRLRLVGAAALIAAWQALRSADETEVDHFTTLASPVLHGLEAAAAALTVGYVNLLTATPVLPDLTDLGIDQDLRDPFVGVWRDLKRGLSLTDALRTGADRSRSLADERVSLTQRTTAERLDESGQIVGWRRVPQGSTCSFCVRAATQRYHTAEAAGNVGHRNRGREFCDCDVVPIVGNTDPGQVINRPMLEAWERAQATEPAYFDATTLHPAPRPAPNGAPPTPDTGDP